MDFLAFYTGASMVKEGKSTKLYSLAEQRKEQYVISEDQRKNRRFIPFYNPPFVALALTPLTYTSLLRAYELWFILNVIILCVTILLIYNMFIKRSFPLTVGAIIMTIIFLPNILSLLFGQWGTVLFFLFLATWFLWAKKYFFAAGFILSLILVKPHFLLLIVLVLLLQKQWQILKGFALGVFILGLLSLFIVGPAGIVSYFNILTQITSVNKAEYSMDIFSQHSLQTVFMLSINTSSIANVRPLWIVSSLVFIVCTCYLWRKKYSPTSVCFGLQWATLIIASLLVSPHTHFHDLPILMSANIALLFSFSVSKTKQVKKILLATVIMSLITLTTLSLLTISKTTSSSTLIYISVGSMILEYAVLSWLLLRGRLQ